MKARTTAIGFAAALALALPSAAVGEGVSGSVVPPENSAATQYTEAIPTAGGDKQAEGGKKSSPKKVLGAKNAHKLESQGKAGQEVAEVVAETAPESSAPAERSPAPEPKHKSTGGGDHEADGNGKAGGTGAKGHHANGGNRPPGDKAPAAPQPEASTSTELPSGSSAFGEVLAAMTGSSSSGELGAWLPLAILAALAWALAYFWRQRRPAS